MDVRPNIDYFDAFEVAIPDALDIDPAFYVEFSPKFWGLALTTLRTC